MTETFPGSRWWRFDFHTHTPASSDYDATEAATLAPREWLLACMGASVDAVAVTDHNCSDWIERRQNTRDRETICRVMDGGRQAFRQRCQRILEVLDDLKKGRGVA